MAASAASSTSPSRRISRGAGQEHPEHLVAMLAAIPGRIAAKPAAVATLQPGRGVHHAIPPAGSPSRPNRAGGPWATHAAENADSSTLAEVDMLD